MTNYRFSGKPPKSAGFILHLLKDIHNWNEIKPAGPYPFGLPKDEEMLVRSEAHRLHEDEKPIPSVTLSQEPWPQFQPRRRSKRKPRRLVGYVPKTLLFQAVFAGGLTGLLIGFNIGVGLPAITGNMWHLAIAPLAFATVGSVLGGLTARSQIVGIHPELAADISPKLTCIVSTISHTLSTSATRVINRRHTI